MANNTGKGQFKRGVIPWNKKIPIVKDCLACHKEFSVRPSLARVNTCSRSCANKIRVWTPERRQRLSLKMMGNTRGVGRTLSTETRKKISESHKGPKSYLWIADRSKLKDDHKDRGGQLHREWSKNIKNRDGWKCKISNGDCSGRLEAHHILSWSDYPELRYEINNGITLCHAHHPRKRAEEKRMIPTFLGLLASKN